MDKRQLTESDIRARYITPAIEQAEWDPMTQIFHEFGLRAGRISVRGRAPHRDQATILKADYALFFKSNIPIAAVEAKDNNHGIGIGAGMPQAIEYARLLGVPFAFASNGDGFIFRDETLADGVLEKKIALHEFPGPQQLWDRYCAWKGWATFVSFLLHPTLMPVRASR